MEQLRLNFNKADKEFNDVIEYFKIEVKKEDKHINKRCGRTEGHLYERFLTHCFNSKENLKAWLQKADLRAKTDFIVKNNITEKLFCISLKSYNGSMTQVLTAGKHSRFRFFTDNPNVLNYIQNKDFNFNDQDKRNVESAVRHNIIDLLCECFEGAKNCNLNATHLCLLKKDNSITNYQLDMIKSKGFSEQEEIDIFNKNINNKLEDAIIFNIQDIILKIIDDESIKISTQTLNGGDRKHSLSVDIKINQKYCNLLLIKTHGRSNLNPQVMCAWDNLIKFIGIENNELFNII